MNLGGGQVQAAVYAAEVVPCWTLPYLALCGVGEAGILAARGTDIDPSTSRSSLFAAAGVRIAGILPLGSGLSIRVHADGVVNLHRATLALGPDAPVDVWPAPLVAGTVGIGVAKRFP